MSKKYFNFKNIFLFITLLTVLIFIQYGVFTFAKFNIPIYEDTEYGLLHKTKFIEQFFTNVYHGRFISNFLTCFLGSILPHSFNIHPIAFYQNIAPLIKGFFLFVLFFQICGFLYRNKNKDLFLPVLIFFFYLQYQFNFAYKYQDIEYCSFYGFLFPFLFFNLFWYKFINCFDYNVELSKKDNLVLIFYAFLCGISTEFTNIVTFFALFFIFLFNKQLFKIYLFPYIALITGMILYYTNNGFLNELNSHPPLFFNINILNSEFISNLKPFLCAVYDVITTEYKFYLLLIILLSIFLIKKYGQKSKNNIMLLMSLLCGSLVFGSFLMINPELSPNKIYYISHFDIIIQYKILFVILIFYLFNTLKLNILAEKILLSLIIFAVIKYDINTSLNPFLTEIFTPGYKIKQNSEEYNNCVERYIYEKINLWYMKEKKQIITIPNKPNKCYIRSVENEIIYMEYVYNLKNGILYDILEFNNIQEAYNQYLQDGGEEISPKELEKCNFKILLS